MCPCSLYFAKLKMHLSDSDKLETWSSTETVCGTNELPIVQFTFTTLLSFIFPLLFACTEVVWFLLTVGTRVINNCSSYFRREKFFLMAFVQISALEGRAETQSLHMLGCVSDPGVEKESGTEGRNEGKSAAYDTESNPAISCTRSQSCSAPSIYGNGICMKGKPRLTDQNWCWNSFVLTSGNRFGPRVWFSVIWLVQMKKTKLSSDFLSFL